MCDIVGTRRLDGVAGQAMTTGRRGETCLPPCSHLKTVGTSSSSSPVVCWSTSIGAPLFGGVGASGGRGDVAGPGATALGRSETGRCPVGGMGAFSGRGREPGGSSPPTSLAHWLPMAYVVRRLVSRTFEGRGAGVGAARGAVVLLESRRRRRGGARAKAGPSAPALEHCCRASARDVRAQRQRVNPLRYMYESWGRRWRARVPCTGVGAELLLCLLVSFYASRAIEVFGL